MEEVAEYEVGFQITDDSKATWAMKKLREKVLKMRENERIAKEQLDAVADWLKEVNSSLERDATFLDGHLKDYMRRERANRKSIKLPWGTIKSTASTKIEVEPEFVEWAQNEGRDDLLRFYPPEPNKAAIAEAGPLPHVSVLETVSYSVKVKE